MYFFSQDYLYMMLYSSTITSGDVAVPLRIMSQSWSCPYVSFILHISLQSLLHLWLARKLLNERMRHTLHFTWYRILILQYTPHCLLILGLLNFLLAKKASAHLLLGHLLLHVIIPELISVNGTTKLWRGIVLLLSSEDDVCGDPCFLWVIELQLNF
jgi:hypothetical protein